MRLVLLHARPVGKSKHRRFIWPTNISASAEESATLLPLTGAWNFRAHAKGPLHIALIRAFFGCHRSIREASAHLNSFCLRSSSEDDRTGRTQDALEESVASIQNEKLNARTICVVGKSMNINVGCDFWLHRDTQTPLSSALFSLPQLASSGQKPGRRSPAEVTVTASDSSSSYGIWHTYLAPHKWELPR